MKKYLHTAYLRLDTPSTSLAKSALSQIILKISHLLGDEPKIKEVKKKLNQILETEVNDRKFKDALSQLKKDRKIEIKDQKIRINHICKDTLAQLFKDSEKKYNEVIEKYFSQAQSNINDIKKWFEDVNIFFLEKYFYDWIGKLTKDKRVGNEEFDLEKIYKSSFAKNSNLIQSDYSWLKEQYYKFLYSEDATDNSLLWEFGTSLFSALLISSNLSADQLSLEQFRDSTLILDTNILLELQLEESNYSNTFSDLEKVLGKINTRLAFFQISNEEYNNKISQVYSDLKRLFAKFSTNVLKDVDDLFVRTALSRGCTTEEDIDRFIDQINHVPVQLYENLKISIIDYNELQKEIEKGQNNSAIIRQINECYKKLHNGRRKYPNSLIHDAGLICGAQHLRENQKCIILTLDKTLITFAIENIVRDNSPIAIGLDTLINVLAINNGGTDIDPSNFAPLFAKIVKMGLNPQKGLFRIEDLSFVLDSHLQINSLPDESIKKIIKKLSINRLSNKSDEMIALSLRRDFESEKLKIQDDFDTLKKVQEYTESENNQLKKELNKLKERYANEIRAELEDKYDRKIFWNRIIYFLALPSLTIIATFGIIWINNSGISDSWKQYSISFLLNIIFWLTTSIFVTNPKLIKKHKERIDLIENEIRHRIENYNA